MTGLPQEGWYPDPTDDRSWRWWDGARWTTDVEPREPEPAVPAPTSEVASPTPIIETGWTIPAAPVPTPILVEQAPIAADAEVLPVEPVDVAATPDPEITASEPRAPFTWDTWSPPTNDGGPTPGESASANTPWIWLLAFTPYIYGILAGVLLGVGLTLAVTAALDPVLVLLIAVGALLLPLVLIWIFAGLDGRALRAHGFSAPGVSWMLLLPPLAYFLARRSHLKRDGARSRGPQIAYSIVFALTVLGLLAAAGAGYLLATGSIVLPAGVIPSGIIPSGLVPDGLLPAGLIP